MSLDLKADVLGAFRFLIKLGDYGWIFGLTHEVEGKCLYFKHTVAVFNITGRNKSKLSFSISSIW